MTTILEATGLVAVATLFGSMAFFSFALAPLIFIELGVETAGRLVRRIFPWYYLVIGVTSLLALVSLWTVARLPAVIMAAVLFGAVVARQVLMPAINRNRDRAAAGDTAAGRRFDRLHRLSVLINGFQLIAAFATLILVSIHG